MRYLFKILIVSALFVTATKPCSGNTPERFTTLVTTILNATGGKLTDKQLINAPESLTVLLPHKYNKFEIFKTVYTSVVQTDNSKYMILQPWKQLNPQGIYSSLFRIKEDKDKVLLLYFVEEYYALGIIEIEIDSQIRELLSSDYPTIFNILSISKYIECITSVTGGYIKEEYIQNINDEEYVLISSIQLSPDISFETLVKDLTLLDIILRLGHYNITFGWTYCDNYWYVNYTLDGKCLDLDDYITPYISLKFIPDKKVIHIIFSRTKSKSMK